MEITPTENTTFTGKVPNPRRRQSWPSLLLAIGMLCSAPLAIAQTSEPANKPAVAINRGPITTLAPGQQVKILTETVKTSKPTDLLLSVTAECSIITDVATVGDQTQEAGGKIEVFLTMDNDPTPLMPTGGTGPSHPTQGDTAEVVFANQIYRKSTTVGLDDQMDRHQTYLETKHANAFNWAVLNAQSGVHTIHVWARYTENETTSATASGMIGNRSLVVQPVKCQVHETVVDGTPLPAPLPVPLN